MSDNSESTSFFNINTAHDFALYSQLYMPQSKKRKLNELTNYDIQMYASNCKRIKHNEDICA